MTSRRQVTLIATAWLRRRCGRPTSHRSSLIPTHNSRSANVLVKGTLSAQKPVSQVKIFRAI